MNISETVLRNFDQAQELKEQNKNISKAIRIDIRTYKAGEIQHNIKEKKIFKCSEEN